MAKITKFKTGSGSGIFLNVLCFYKSRLRGWIYLPVVSPASFIALYALITPPVFESSEKAVFVFFSEEVSGEVVTTNLYPGNWFKMIGEAIPTAMEPMQQISISRNAGEHP